jgi:hypothetical protein
MTPDHGWETLSTDWQRTEDVPALDALRERARRHGRRLALVTAIELTICLVAAVSLVIVWQKSTRLEPRLLVLGLGTFSAIAAGFTLRNRRGTWRAVEDTLDGHRALERRRRAMRINGARFAWTASLVMLPFMVGVTAWRVVHDGVATLESGVAIASVMYLAAWIVGGRRQERRLRELAATES